MSLAVWDHRQLLSATVSKGSIGSQLLTDIFSLDWEASDDFHPDDTNTAEDYEKTQFLDLRKPLLRQIWEANFRSELPMAILRNVTDICTVNLITFSKCINPVICLNPLVYLDQMYLK